MYTKATVLIVSLKRLLYKNYDVIIEFNDYCQRTIVASVLRQNLSPSCVGKHWSPSCVVKHALRVGTMQYFQRQLSDCVKV
jgi:hypothetical protein